jgi:hypothetical protein
VNYDFEIGPDKGTLGLTAFNVYNRQNVWHKEFTSVQGLELREWHELQGTSALRSGSTQASLPMS